MSDSESDIEMKSTLTKKSFKKTPKSPSEEVLLKEPKKMTTKDMINAALKELNTRKGVSLQAIKKYMVEKYGVNTDKINFYIKKYIKSGVESGTIIQTKGIGASGSFKLAPVKTEKKKQVKKIEKTDKPKKGEKIEKSKKKTENSKKGKTEKGIKKPDAKTVKTQKKEKLTATKGKEKKTAKESKEYSKAKKVTVTVKTPAKKKVIVLKRKSIGSIIKPPKMKPKKA